MYGSRLVIFYSNIRKLEAFFLGSMIRTKMNKNDDLNTQVGLANTVDNALLEFNIDGKGCVAKSM